MEAVDKEKIVPSKEAKKPEEGEEPMADEGDGTTADKKKPKKLIKIAMTEDEVQQMILTQFTSFMDTVIKKIDDTVKPLITEVKESVTKMDTRIKTSEQLIAEAQKAITGTVVNGSETDDGVPVQKRQKEEADFDFDTAFNKTVRRPVRAA